MILYNCHHDGDQYRITKFVDGNPESSYLTTLFECQCPAGSRPTCRHRQMLSVFINMELINTHWFIGWDEPSKPILDLSGARMPYDQSPLVAPRSTPGSDGIRLDKIGDNWRDAVRAANIETTTQPAPFRRRL